MKVKKEVKLLLPVIVFMLLIVIISSFSNSTKTISNSIKESKDIIIIDNNTDIKSEPGILNRTVNELLKRNKKSIIDNNIAYYAKFFNLNTEKVVSIARSLTNDYESESFINKHTIKDGDGEFSSLEAGIVYFIRYIYRNPEKYGTTSSEIVISNSIKTEKNRVDGHIKLDSGETYEQFLERICNLYNINKVLALAIVYEESGKMTSSLFNYSNNMGGLRSSGTNWLSFPSLEAGTISYVFTLKNLLDRYNLDSFNRNHVYLLSGIYVHGNISDPADHWTGNVTNYMNIIEKNNAFQ